MAADAIRRDQAQQDSYEDVISRGRHQLGRHQLDGTVTAEDVISRMERSGETEVVRPVEDFPGDSLLGSSSRKGSKESSVPSSSAVTTSPWETSPRWRKGRANRL